MCTQLVVKKIKKMRQALFTDFANQFVNAVTTTSVLVQLKIYTDRQMVLRASASMEHSGTLNEEEH